MWWLSPSAGDMAGNMTEKCPALTEHPPERGERQPGGKQIVLTMMGDQRERLERSEDTSQGGHVGAETGKGIF